MTRLFGFGPGGGILRGLAKESAVSTEITPNTTLTFTVTSVPKTAAKVKTIERLMWMQPDAKKTLRNLQRQRANQDNVTTIRAGRPWINRAKATRPQRCEAGEEFTLHVTPTLVDDLKSVSQWLDARPA